MRFLRWIFISLAVVVVLAVVAIAVGGAWLNNYIRSDAFKKEVEVRAGQTLGGTVRIDTVDFDLFHGVKLTGLVAQMDAGHSGGQGALLVRVGKVDCTYAWTELFKRRLKLTGVALDQPQIILTKEVVTPAQAQARPGFADSGGAQGEGTATPFQFILDRAKVNDGAVTVKNEEGTAIVDLQGVNADADTSTYNAGGDVTGTVQVAKVAFSSGLRASDFSTPFTWHHGVLVAKPLEAASFGGSLAGAYQLGNTGPSILDLNAKEVDVKQFTDAMTSSSSAKLSGSLDWQSKWRGAETGVLNGEGDAQLTRGKLSGVKILEDLSGLLRAKEMAAPDISKAQTHFLVENRQTRFTGLQLQSTIFSMTGDGVIGFDGGVDANLVLILTRDGMGKLPKELAASFVQQQDGAGSIAFHVTGTTSNPQTDLPTRLLLQNTQIQNVINKQLNKFFNKKSNPQDPNQPNQNQPGNPLQNLIPGFH